MKSEVINGKMFIQYPQYHCAFCGAIQMTKFRRDKKTHEIIGFDIDTESHIPNCKYYE